MESEDSSENGGLPQKRKGGSSAVVVVVCVALVVLAVAYAVVSRAEKKSGGFDASRAASRQQKSEVSVRTQAAAEEVLHDYVSTNGEVEVQNSVDVFPDIGGKIVEVYVALGSRVRRGQIIAEVDPSEPGAYYAHSQVYAPISGTITATPLKRGTTVSVSTAVATIGDVANLQVTASVPERYVAYLARGLKADISLEAFPGEVFRATVSRVSPVLDKASRTKEIILNFDSKDGRVDAGMFAKVVLYTADYGGFPVLPSDSVIDKNGKKYIYVVDSRSSTASEREVQTGREVDNVVQITEGLSAGERVVVEGMRSLSDGALVKDISLVQNGSSAAEEKDGPEND